jgi:hypothetical protein
MNESFRMSRRGVLGGAAASLAIPLLANRTFASTELDDGRGRLSDQYEEEPVARYLHSVAALRNGLVVITGGYHVGEQSRRNQRAPASTAVQIYDPYRDIYYSAAPMTIGRARHASVTLADGRVAVLGGFNLFALSSVEIYDPNADAWSAGPSLPNGMCDHTAILAGSLVVLSGGHTGASAVVHEIAPRQGISNP